MRDAQTLSTQILPEVELRPAGWIMGHAILAGRQLIPGAQNGVRADVVVLTPQAEPDAASAAWTTTLTPLARTPLGCLAHLTTSCEGKGFFGVGADRYSCFVHIQGDRILGANASSSAAISERDSDKGILAEALDEMDADQLDVLARLALAASTAKRASENAKLGSEDALGRLRLQMMGAEHKSARA